MAPARPAAIPSVTLGWRWTLSHVDVNNISISWIGTREVGAELRSDGSAAPAPDGELIVGPDPTQRWNDLGAFIREQRNTARLSLRRLSELAGVSNPYLSQIERG